MALFLRCRATQGLTQCAAPLHTLCLACQPWQHLSTTDHFICFIGQPQLGRKEERGRAHSKHSVGGRGCPTSQFKWALYTVKQTKTAVRYSPFRFFSCFRRLEIPYIVQNKVRLGIDRNNSKLMIQKSEYSQAMMTKSVKRS